MAGDAARACQNGANLRQAAHRRERLHPPPPRAAVATSHESSPRGSSLRSSPRSDPRAGGIAERMAALRAQRLAVAGAGRVRRCVSTASYCWTRPKRSSAVLRERQRPAIERTRTAAAQGLIALTSCRVCFVQFATARRSVANRSGRIIGRIVRSTRTPFILLGSGPAFGEISPTLPPRLQASVDCRTSAGRALDVNLPSAESAEPNRLVGSNARGGASRQCYA